MLSISTLSKFSKKSLLIGLGVILISGVGVYIAYRLAIQVPTVSEITKDTLVQQQSPVSIPTTNPTVANCIVTIAGKGYDVTRLITTHSGGDIFNCGTDSTDQYNSQHGIDYSRIAIYLVDPSSATGTSSATGATSSGTTFTSQTLAVHNKAGDCYVAYKGVVYNVSKHPQWKTCAHQGMRGGTDITSRFPHAFSYISSLPKMGTTSTSSNSTSTGGNSSAADQKDEDENEDDDENEVEDED